MVEIATGWPTRAQQTKNDGPPLAGSALKSKNMPEMKF